MAYPSPPKNAPPVIKAQKTKQEAIAASCDISIQTLRGWITKKRFPNAPEAHRIAQALGVTVEYLVSGKEPENSKKEVLDDLQAVINRHRKP